jgi:hypothetical protein
VSCICLRHSADEEKGRLSKFAWDTQCNHPMAQCVLTWHMYHAAGARVLSVAW